MCGRFTQNYSWSELHAFFSLFGTPRNLQPRYNIAPTTPVDVVRAGSDGHELQLMRWLKKHLVSLKKRKISVVVGGDFNVIPEDIDCYSPKAWATNALFQPEAQERLRAIVKLGYIDAFRHFNNDAHEYTFWDYFRNHWKNNRGIRIDHFLVSAALKDRITGCMIDKSPRDHDHPSDHTPIVLAIR